MDLVRGVNVRTCALRNAGIAFECPSEVDPARLTTPNGKRLEVLDIGALEEGSFVGRGRRCFVLQRHVSPW